MLSDVQIDTALDDIEIGEDQLEGALATQTIKRFAGKIAGQKRASFSRIDDATRKRIAAASAVRAASRPKPDAKTSKPDSTDGRVKVADILADAEKSAAEKKNDGDDGEGKATAPVDPVLARMLDEAAEIAVDLVARAP